MTATEDRELAHRHQPATVRSKRFAGGAMWAPRGRPFLALILAVALGLLLGATGARAARLTVAASSAVQSPARSDPLPRIRIRPKDEPPWSPPSGTISDSNRASELLRRGRASELLREPGPLDPSVLRKFACNAACHHDRVTSVYKQIRRSITLEEYQEILRDMLLGRQSASRAVAQRTSLKPSNPRAKLLIALFKQAKVEITSSPNGAAALAYELSRGSAAPSLLRALRGAAVAGADG
jgi:hypothetical protein